MSFSTIIQRQAHTAGTIRRHVSNKASKPKSHTTLPSAKMRALISLYHQADTFITPENLDERIDDAFVPKKNQTRLSRQNFSEKDLRSLLTSQRKAPKISEWDQEAVVIRDSNLTASTSTMWSSLRSARELKVIEALYGVDATHPHKILPGLEVLEESAERIEQNINADMRNEKRKLFSLDKQS